MSSIKPCLISFHSADQPDRMADITLSTYGVEKLLRGLKTNKAIPDNIHPWALKEIATDFAPILSHLVSNLSQMDVQYSRGLENR